MSEVDKTSPQPSSNQYHAPNADHIPDALISRRALYRHIERIAGMQVSQYDHDCITGDPVLRPNPKPADIYAHVLKAIANFESPDETSASDAADARRYRWLKAEDRKPMPLGAISWRTRAGNLPCKLGDCDNLDRLIDAAMAAPPTATAATLTSALSSPVKATAPQGGKSILDRKVTVCEACLCASCWQGEFYCDNHKTAGTVEKTIRELYQLSKQNVREDSGYWFKDPNTGKVDYDAKSRSKRAWLAENGRGDV